MQQAKLYKAGFINTRVEARKNIEDLLKKAREGTDFGELAKLHSEDPGSKNKGGEYTFPRGQMVAECEEVAFSLEINQISDVVETTYGYHIIKLSERLPAETKTFEQVKDEIFGNLERMKVSAFMRTYQKEVMDKADITWHDKSLAPAPRPAAPRPVNVPVPAQEKPPAE